MLFANLIGVIQAVQDVSSRIDQPLVSQMKSQAVANTLNALSKFDHSSEWAIQAILILSSYIDRTPQDCSIGAHNKHAK